MSKRITATYHDTQEANAAIERLVRVGFPAEDISVSSASSMDDSNAHSAPEAPPHSNTREPDMTKGAVDGSMVGGTLGVIIAGTLAATAASGLARTVMPFGAEIIQIAGPIVAAVVGGGAGAAAGAVAGGVVGLIMGEGAAQDHEADTFATDTLVAVDTDGKDTAIVRSLLNTKTTVTSN